MNVKKKPSIIRSIKWDYISKLFSLFMWLEKHIKMYNKNETAREKSSLKVIQRINDTIKFSEKLLRVKIKYQFIVRKR